VSHLVFVANAGADRVTAYPLKAHGNVAPKVTIAGNHTGLNQPTSLAFNDNFELFVANPAANSITVYAPGANGNVAPIRTIAGPATKLVKPRAVAIDGDGSIFVGTGDPPLGNQGFLKFAAGANGNVPPLTTIVIAAQVGAHGPVQGISIDWQQNAWVEWLEFNKSEILFYPHGATVSTGLILQPGQPPMPMGSKYFAIGVTVRDTQVFAANSGPDGITAYPTTALANPPSQPSVEIAGASTKLAAPVALAFADDGRFFVANSGNDSIAAFAPGANGNVAPVQVIAGASTGLAKPSGIAIGAW
jgi:hypothetical protein